MTEQLLRSLARRPATALARPSAVLVYSIVLAFGGVLWLRGVHSLQGSHDGSGAGFIEAWLRDGVLALPLMFVWTWVAVLAARRLLRLFGEESRLLCTAVLAAVVASVGSVALALGSPLHAVLYGARPAVSHELSALAHLGWETAVALTATLPLTALASIALLRMRPWAAPDPRTWLALAPSAQRLRMGVLVAMLVVIPAATMARSGIDGATAQAGAAGPCPAGAPVKTYDVRAIDVDITLNRYGDHDPLGKMYVLADRVDDVRREEASGHVSIGLRDDAIQPLAIRANLGDCLVISFRNDASGGDYGMHVDGLSFDVSSSGDAVGRNSSSAAGPGQTRVYRYYVPENRELEGAHYVRPGPGNRQAAAHGLFGAVLVEPQGSTYLDMDTGEPIRSGWEAMIVPGNGKKAFREYAIMMHEIGDEQADILDRNDEPLPVVDPLTDGYRPGSRALNYRSEPFMRRLERNGRMKAHAYGSYAFGDPPTPMPRAYKGDPTKIRVMHGGSEVFHVFHLHGGGIRWRFNPHSDTTFDYADTGLKKVAKPAQSASSRLDSQSTGPGESFDVQVEGGAGGTQQGAGEFLYHCHIAEHYVAGMWSFWRVYDTLQPNLAPLPDRAPLPASVNSAELIGKKMPDGSTLTKDNIDDWIRPQLPPQGVPQGEQDATVWDWKIDTTDPERPLYIGEPEDRRPWPGLTNALDAQRLDGHPGLYPGDVPVGPDDRPEIRFNPNNGRPAFPLLRPQIGDRAPFSPRGHSGAPWLGESGGQAASGPGPSPWAGRPDGICPAGAPSRSFNVVALDVPVPVTRTSTDQKGKIFVLAKDVEDVLAGRKPAQPLAIRGNQGDCVALTLTSRQTDDDASDNFAKVNMHIHHVQFDTQASDGVVSGLSYEQSVRPYAIEDPTLRVAAAGGTRVLSLSSVAKFQPGVFIGVGLGRESIAIHEIESIDTAARTVTLTEPLADGHAAGEAAGVEFVQYRWFPDAMLDNVFWHDHVDGIHGWARGLVGQFVVEPPGSTYHDPRTGAPVESGTIVDIRTNSPLAASSGVSGSFREMVTWTIGDNPVTDSTINLRAEPFADRLAANPDPSLLFSSWTHGDPVTPLPMAYGGDPFVIRNVSVSPDADTLHVNGHRFNQDTRMPGSTAVSTLMSGVSERHTLILQGGAGGPQARPGDYMYMNGVGRRFRQGAWGLMRVLGRQVPELQPLPGRTVPTGGSLPSPTGGRPPETAAAGNPCPSGAPLRSFRVSAVDLPAGAPAGTGAAYVPSEDAAAVRSGALRPEPLVLHAAQGECVEVRFTNERSVRASFHLDELVRSAESSGINVGYGPEQTAAPGQGRTYRFYADTDNIGSAQISDFGDMSSGADGLYGALVVAAKGATFSDPATGKPTSVGAQVDVRLPDGDAYRDFTLNLADDDPVIGGNSMPYPSEVSGPSLVNYRSAPRPPNTAGQFSSAVHGDPETPLLRAYAGDKVRVHALAAPGNEAPHVLSLGGQAFSIDPLIPNANELGSRLVGPRQAVDFSIEGGAGGRNHSVGDFFYGDLRRAFTDAGMWGLMRVLPNLGCDQVAPIRSLPCPPPGSGEGSGSDDGPGPAGTSSDGTPDATAKQSKGALRKVRVARRVGLRSLRKPGLRIRLEAPAGARVLQLRLLRKRRGGLLDELVAQRLMIRAGRVDLRWRPSRSDLRALKPGAYLLELRGGGRSGLWSARIETRLLLRG